jgi:secreted PhoX family phosphatase
MQSLIEKLEAQELSRRRFLEFMGRASVTAAGALTAANLLSACASAVKSGDSAGALKLLTEPRGPLSFRPINPVISDELKLATGFESQVLLQWGDAINSREQFGFNNDYLAYLPLDASNPHDGLLWSNHEYVNEIFVSEYDRKGSPKTKDQVITEMRALGGSIVRIKRDSTSGKWNVVKGDRYNRRIDGTAKIPMIVERPIEGSKTAIGTMANCAGGVTPWGTVLSCEENYQDYYGEVTFKDGKREKTKPSRYSLGWERYYDRPPEHYGWVVEVELRTGKAKKLCALGRFAHEGATVRLAADGRPVAYMGDDANDECLYKFISDKKGSLEKGTLYVADTERGEWVPLTLDNPKLKGKFKDQTELLIRTREAARLAGGTALDRPEDIEIDPATGAVIVALTNNKPKNRPHGQLLKLEEAGNDPLALTFKASTFFSGGASGGLSCPDNLVFDRKGNLWVTTDMSGSDIGPKGPYAPFGNNGLFYIPMSGPDAGRAFQVASAPMDAEFTGPYFSPDGGTLFLAVQHPGEESKSKTELTSHWPRGGVEIPRPSVVAITGPGLRALTGA